MSYRDQRNYENLQRACFYGEGEYDIPVISPVRELDCENWIGWNFAKTCDDPEVHGVHFFVDDYQFERVWSDPDRYTERLAKFKAVCTPDFSPYADFPKAVQVFNHYRKHWLGAYWQMHGATVIPTITWSDPSTLEWCFDGEPHHSIVALSSVGMLNNPVFYDWMMTGYWEMVKRIDPIRIIWKGSLPKEIENSSEMEKVFHIPSFTDKWRDKR